MKYQADVQQPPYPQPAPAQPEEQSAYINYQREQERVMRWHETYNAAAQGLFARGDLLNQVSRLAKEFADDTHGPL
jgi:hypothetical protein